MYYMARFAKRMFQGQCHLALQLLEERGSTGVLGERDALPSGQTVLEASLVPRPHPKIGKGAWCYLQIFLCVLCQQSLFGVEESRSSIANYNIPSSIISHSLEFLPCDKRTKSRRKCDY